MQVCTPYVSASHLHASASTGGSPCAFPICLALRPLALSRLSRVSRLPPPASLLALLALRNKRLRATSVELRAAAGTSLARLHPCRSVPFPLPSLFASFACFAVDPSSLHCVRLSVPSVFIGLHRMAPRAARIKKEPPAAAGV